MGLFDDILNTAKSQFDSAKSEIQNYVAGRAAETVSSFVKVGPKPSGNLTPAEIAAGARGSTPPLAPPRAQPQEIARAQSSVPSPVMVAGVSIPILIAVGLGAFLLFKKRG